MTRYPAVVDGCKGAHGVVISDIPGACCSMGRTVDEALLNAESALADFVRILEEGGKPIPPPSSIDDIAPESGEMVAYVPLRVLSRPKARTAASLIC